ncbi:MAG: hsp70 family protein [Hahellaceae bacterium]|nr:hsp70 family protein [Hahellaceae bacterium]
MAHTPRFLIGIDLGTTHTVVAYAPMHVTEDNAPPQLFEIEQLVGPGELAKRPLLPSLRYHATENEIAPQDRALPWDPMGMPGEIPGVIIGEWARVLGAKTQGRLVTSAKSWLSHPQIDAQEACLPWSTLEGEAITRVTPTQASASYLFHVRQAWNRAFPDALLEHQAVVLTVPASFDENARNLTLKAAEMAGVRIKWLVEEPQAVVYDWFASQGENAVEQLKTHSLILVCDVGGGTTDFSLIRITLDDRRDEPFALERIGVGDHLMLGGDNLDLALAHQLETQLSGPDQKLNTAALSQLVLQTRIAKEQLLAEDSPESVSVTLLGSGSRLIGGARRTDLTRQAVHKLALEGFLPHIDRNERPTLRRNAMTTLGLPYVSDPAITRHLADFLARHGCKDIADYPDTLLLNGGAFNSPLLRERLQRVLEAWREGPIEALHNPRPDLSVALGAVIYGRARSGQFMRIGGGSPRSYFLRLENAGQADSTGLCLLPKGTEEEKEIFLKGRRFALRVGQPVKFHLMSSTDETHLRSGDVTSLNTLNCIPLPPLIVALPGGGASEAEEVEVELVCSLSELGSLQLICQRIDQAEQRWKLEFQVRTNDIAALSAQTENAPAPLPTEAITWIQEAFSKDTKISLPLVKQLRSLLEKRFGKREDWSLDVSRSLAATMLQFAKARRQSPAHERVWLNLTGHMLRPGYGAPTDAWSIEQIWPLFSQGLAHTTESQLWSEWWTFWRRLAGGLDGEKQKQIFRKLEGYISPAALRSRKVQADPASKSYEDMVRLVASLERLPLDIKSDVAGWLATRLEKPRETPISWWALGRLATRVPFHGSAYNVIPRSQVFPWVAQMLKEDWRKNTAAAFAAVMVARPSEDRDQDIGPELRDTILSSLKSARAPDSWIKLAMESQALTEEASRQLYGEALPAGLKLLH